MYISYAQHTSRGGNARQLVGYLANENESEKSYLLGAPMGITDLNDQARLLMIPSQESQRNFKNDILHIYLRSDYDDLSVEKWQAIGDRFLDKLIDKKASLGKKEGKPEGISKDDFTYVMALHEQEREIAGGYHMHIAINRNDNNNGRSFIDDRFLGLSLKKISKDLEQEFNLNPAQACDKQVSPSNKERIKRGSEPKYDNFLHIQTTIDKAFKDGKILSFDDLKNHLEKNKIETRATFNKAGELTGVSFSSDVIEGSRKAFKGSELGKKYTAKALTTKISEAINEHTSKNEQRNKPKSDAKTAPTNNNGADAGDRTIKIAIGAYNESARVSRSCKSTIETNNKVISRCVESRQKNTGSIKNIIDAASPSTYKLLQARIEKDPIKRDQLHMQAEQLRQNEPQKPLKAAKPRKGGAAPLGLMPLSVQEIAPLMPKIETKGYESPAAAPEPLGAAKGTAPPQPRLGPVYMAKDSSPGELARAAQSAEANKRALADYERQLNEWLREQIEQQSQAANRQAQAYRPRAA